MRYHRPNGSHPGSCPGCTADYALHGQKVRKAAERVFCKAKLNLGAALAIMQEHSDAVIEGIDEDVAAGRELDQLAADLYSLLETMKPEAT